MYQDASLVDKLLINVSLIVSKGFRGVVEIDPAQLGGSTGAISHEVVQGLASIMGSNRRATLEIQIQVPDSIWEKIEHDASDNCDTLRFRKYDFRSSG